MSLRVPSLAAFMVSWVPSCSICSRSAPDLVSPIPRTGSSGRIIPSIDEATSSGRGTMLKLKAVSRIHSSHWVMTRAVTVTVTIRIRVSVRALNADGNLDFEKTHAICSGIGSSPVGSASSISSWVMSLEGSYIMAGRLSSGPRGASLVICERSSICDSSSADCWGGARPSPCWFRDSRAAASWAAISSGVFFSIPRASVRFRIASRYRSTSLAL
mmetsp:Transcript_23912/g.56501  ORF Transcript_23912/g.56501 Transcript_23912/m.56501 type:complete len:215 (+) Transcript_23912:370-1014(+)